MKIHWNGFLEKAVKEYPKEACAFLFSKEPYSINEEWFVFPVKNVAENPEEQWIPDKKETLKIKNESTKQQLVKIGNIHTHCLHGENIDEMFKPSNLDLKFAQRFNDIIRGIIVVNKISIFGIMFHDKFGNKIHIGVESE